MEDKLIAIDMETYNRLKQATESDQKYIYFTCFAKDKIISVPNVSKSNGNKEINIVEKWMKEIIAMANEGYQDTDDENSETYFKSIVSYCKAVITSVTS